MGSPMSVPVYMSVQPDAMVPGMWLPGQNTPQGIVAESGLQNPPSVQQTTPITPNIRFSQKSGTKNRKKTVWLDLPTDAKVDAGIIKKKEKSKKKMPNPILKTHPRTPTMVSNLEEYAHKMGDKEQNFQAAKEEDEQ